MSELQRIVNRKRLGDPVPQRLPEVKWNSENIRKTVTNTFGKIKFVNVEHFGGTKPAKVEQMNKKNMKENITIIFIC